MLRRFFYRQFRIASRVSWALARQLTPAGRLVVGALLTALVFGPNTRLTVGYQAFTLLGALLALSTVWALVPPPRLDVRRRLPRYATAGETVIYDVVLRNRRARAVVGLSILEDLEDPRPTLADFTLASEPHESERNWFDRKLAWHRWVWLLARNRRLDVREHTVSEVPSAGEARVRVEALARRRGRVRFRGLTLARTDPLGLVRALRRLRAPDTLLVLPRRYPVPDLTLPGARRYQPGGIALASSVGDSEEFVSLREYRPGDPLKRIHWRSSARRGRAVVREHQDEFFVRHGLVLDTFMPRGGEPRFEDAVAVAASFAAGVRGQEALLDLMFVGPQAYVFTAGRGVGQLERMLEVLADVMPCADGSFAVLHRLVAERHQALSGVVCVLLAWDDQRRGLLQHLRALGVPALALLVTGADQAVDADELASEGVRRLVHDHIAEGLAGL
ncbi:MAG TPA: DUF58 domain-containing protein [Methylomirabilota bacterium]|nr:DUF58 domain-containing protein [Methylomirabilota bacterium]